MLLPSNLIASGFMTLSRMNYFAPNCGREVVAASEMELLLVGQAPKDCVAIL